MWEIFTGGVMPYDKMKNVEVVDYVCHSKLRLEKPGACPEKIYKVMLQCWQHVCTTIYLNLKKNRFNNILLQQVKCMVKSL